MLNDWSSNLLYNEFVVLISKLSNKLNVKLQSKRLQSERLQSERLKSERLKSKRHYSF